MSLLDKQEVQNICGQGTLHCTLENGADLYVNECQKIRHYRTRFTEERIRIKRNKRRLPNRDFFLNFVWCVHKIALYGDVIYSFDWK